MPIVVSTETAAAENSSASITRSLAWRMAFLARRSLTTGRSEGVFADMTCEFTGGIPMIKAHPFRGWLFCGETRQQSVLRFALHHFIDGDADFVVTAEDRAELFLLHVLDVAGVGRSRQRHVLHFLGQRGAVLHVELDEFLHFRLVEGLGLYVDEDRTRQRRVGTVLDIGA